MLSVKPKSVWSPALISTVLSNGVYSGTLECIGELDLGEFVRFGELLGEVELFGLFLGEF